jgi:sialidase-1
MISHDNGKTWPDVQPIYAGDGAEPLQTGPGIPTGRGQLLCTRDGTLIIVWDDERVLNWDKALNEPGLDARGDQWAIRSVDGGKTWIDRQRLYEGVCGHPPINMIQTASGRIVVTAQFYLREPGRNVIRVYSSGDEGKTWRGSNIIDLGGHGHHDGAFEPTFVQLQDGRLWMLIRTNWDRFWEAFSDDDGLSWRVIRPSQIEASTSPGYITRLASGRLALVWSRLYPEGADSYLRRSEQFSEAEASWHREELSLAFSEDEGQSWSKPVVLAREKDTWLSYPYLFEPEPGLLWLQSGQGDVRIRFHENEMLEP